MPAALDGLERPFRMFVIGCAVLVAGCSISFDRSEPLAKPVVDLVQQKNIDLQVLKIVETMKGSTAVSLSNIGPNQDRRS